MFRQIFLISLIFLISCHSGSNYETDIATKHFDTSNAAIYNFINELLKDTIISLGSKISTSPIDFPSEKNKEEINRMIVENKPATKEKYYLSGILYYCLKKDEVDFMLESKHELSNFKWDLTRINYNNINDSNWYEISPPLFSRNKTKAIMRISRICPQVMCCSWSEDILFEKLSNKWIKKDNFDFIN